MKRRSFLKAGLAGSALATLPAIHPRGVSAQDQAPRKLLFVVTASGGGSIVDSFMPLIASDATPDTIIAYPEEVIAQPVGSNLRAPVDLVGPSAPQLQLPGNAFNYDYSLGRYLERHYQDTMVMAAQTSSVNHVVAQERAINGNFANGGKTIMEAVAEKYGERQLLPNVNMSTAGYLRTNPDADVAAAFRPEVVASPTLFANATHGTRGVAGAPDAALLERARAARRAIDDGSAFSTRHGASPLLAHWRDLRDTRLPAFESANLIDQLMLLLDQARFPDSEFALDLDSYGLQTSPDAERLLEVFPNYPVDPWQAQGALAFLLAKYNLSTSITIGPTWAIQLFGDRFADTPLAFDFSHTQHVETQNMMWGRIMEVVDGIATLLKEVPTTGGGSLYDESLIYVATDFGRSKVRPAGAVSGFGTGHDVNNGNVFLSPLLEGNRVFGAVDAETGNPYGFSLEDGSPDRGATIREEHLYATIAHALDVEYDGRKDMSVCLRG